MTRSCPRDFSALHSKTVDQFSYLSCPTCNGLWIEWDVIERLCSSAGAHIPAIRFKNLHPMESEHGKRIACPNDGCEMEINYYGDIELDVCWQCQGAWLDGGELQRLAKPAEPKKKNDLAPHEVADGLLHVAGRLINVALEHYAQAVFGRSGGYEKSYKSLHEDT